MFRSSFRSALCAAAGFSFIAASAPAQNAPVRPPAAPATKTLSPELMEKLRKQLDALEKDINQKKKSYNSGLMSQLREASQNNTRAFNLWLDCKKEIDFIQKGKTVTEFVEWKRGSEAQRLEASDSFRNSLRLQAHFLALAVLNSYAETPAARAEVASEAVAYLETMVKFCDSEEGLAKSILGSVIDASLDPNEAVTAGNLEETLKQAREASAAVGGDIMESLFARHLNVEGTVGKPKNSVSNPGNVDEIYERLVLPAMREKGDAAGVAAAWTKRMDQMARIAKATTVKQLVAKYENEKLPMLKWGQACDQWELGQEEPAAQNMLAILRAYPAHKDSNNWLADLRKRAQPKIDGGSAPPAAAPVKPAPATPAAVTVPATGQKAAARP